MSTRKITVWLAPVWVAFGSLAMAADVTDFAVVVTKTVYPGQKVAPNEVASISFAGCNTCEPGFLTDQASVIGKIAGKTLLPNQLIYPDWVRLPPVIKQGAEVMVMFRSGPLTISVVGNAMDNAAFGEPVTVKTRLNNRLIQGTAQADGIVLAGGQ
ncbi:MAG: flagellar basal body P-ring formation chaperone FlgA [Rhizobiaceae bacterium]